MLLQYCDSCQTRIDEGAVTVGDRVLCKPCAVVARASMPKPGSSARHKPVRGSDGVHRPSPAHGTGKRSPVAGVRHGPISSASRLPAQGGGHVRIGTTRARPIPPPPPETEASDAAGTQAAAQSGHKTLILVFAIAAALVALAAVVWVARRGKDTGRALPPKEITETRKQDEPDGGSGAAKKPDASGETASTGEKSGEQGRKGMGFLTGENDDIRGGLAQRELERAIEMEKSGRGSVAELRKRYESIAAAHGTTAAGQEAARRLKALPPLPLRAADQAPATESGLQVRIHEKAGDVRLAEKRFGEMKSLGTAVAKNLDYPPKDKLFALTKGRKTDFVLDISGFVSVPREGEYAFYLDSDDGSAMWLGDQMIIENDGNHGMQERSETVRLAVGKHRIRIGFWQGGSDAGLIFRWSGPDIAKQAVPASALSHAK